MPCFHLMVNPNFSLAHICQTMVNHTGSKTKMAVTWMVSPSIPLRVCWGLSMWDTGTNNERILVTFANFLAHVRSWEWCPETWGFASHQPYLLEMKYPLHRWVMFNWDIYQPLHVLWFLGHPTWILRSSSSSSSTMSCRCSSSTWEGFKRTLGIKQDLFMLDVFWFWIFSDWYL